MSLLQRVRIIFSNNDHYPSYRTVFCLIFAIVLRFLDTIFDIWSAYSYFKDGYCYSALLTILVALISELMSSAISWRMCTPRELFKDADIHRHTTKFEHIPLIRYFHALKYAFISLKAKRLQEEETQKHYFERMNKEKADIALLHVFEVFTEAAPQLVIAIIFLLNKDFSTKEYELKDDWVKILSAVCSFASIAFCLLVYQTDIRRAQKDKNKIDLLGSTSFFLFLWQLCFCISRIIAIGALFHLSFHWAIVAVLVHWLAMTLGISCFEKHQFCSSTRSLLEQKEDRQCRSAGLPPRFNKSYYCEDLGNIVMSAAIGIVLIFAYITPGDGRTRFRYISFYVVICLENCAVACLWLKYVSSTLLVFWCTVPFILGVIFMCIYYCKFHPNKDQLSTNQQSR